MVFEIIATVVGLSSLVIGLVVGRSHLKRMNRIKEQMQVVANQFDGHFIDRGNQLPKLVLNHSGKRFQVSFAHSEVGSLIRVTITSSFASPEFRLSIAPYTLGSRASAWFTKTKCKTDDSTFDTWFLTLANQHADSIDRILTRAVRYEILHGCKLVKNQKQSKNKRRLGAGVFKWSQSGSHLTGRNSVWAIMPSTWRVQRINLNVEAGQSEAKINLAQSEFDRLGEILLAAMTAQSEIDRNYTLLSKEKGTKAV